MRVHWRLGDKAPTIEGLRQAPKKPVPWFGSVTVVTPGGTVQTREWRTPKGRGLLPSQVAAVMQALLDSILEDIGPNNGVNAYWSAQSR